MATIKLKTRSRKSTNDIRLWLKLTHLRLMRPIDLKICVPAHLFDGRFVLDEHPRSVKYNAEIAQSLKIAEDVIERYKHKHISIGRLKMYIMAALGHQGATPAITVFAQTVVDELRERKQDEFASQIAGNVNRFVAWLGRDIPMHQIDQDIVSAYKDFIEKKEVSISTTSNYLRTLRKVWLLAKKEYNIETDNPFDTGIVPTVPKTPSQKAREGSDIKMILEIINERTLPPLQHQVLESRILQICFQGIDFADLAFIDRFLDIDKDGYFSFTRFKNRNRISNPEVKVKVPDLAYTIINQYDSNKLLPMFHGRDPNDPVFKTFRGNARRAMDIVIEKYRIWGVLKDLMVQRGYTHDTLAKAVGHAYIDYSKIHDRLLAKVVNLFRLEENYFKRIGPKPDFGSKAMRHTWLTAAAEFEQEERIRSLAVGHAVKGITAAYIKSNQQRIDSLNAKVIAYLLT